VGGGDWEKTTTWERKNNDRGRIGQKPSSIFGDWGAGSSGPGGPQGKEDGGEGVLYEPGVGKNKKQGSCSEPGHQKPSVKKGGGVLPEKKTSRTQAANVKGGEELVAG